MQASSYVYQIMYEANVQIRPDAITPLNDLLSVLLGHLDMHNNTRRVCSKKVINADEFVSTFCNKFVGHITDDRMWVRGLCIAGDGGYTNPSLATSDMNVVTSLLERVPMDLLRHQQGQSVALRTLMCRITKIVDSTMQAHTYRMRHMVARAALRDYLKLYRTSICSVTKSLQNVSL